MMQINKYFSSEDREHRFKRFAISKILRDNDISESEIKDKLGVDKAKLIRYLQAHNRLVIGLTQSQYYVNVYNFYLKNKTKVMTVFKNLQSLSDLEKKRDIKIDINFVKQKINDGWSVYELINHYRITHNNFTTRLKEQHNTTLSELKKGIVRNRINYDVQNLYENIITSKNKKELAERLNRSLKQIDVLIRTIFNKTYSELIKECGKPRT